MAKHITEVLKEINDDVTLLETVYKKPLEGISPLSIIFYHACMEEGAFMLPEGEPPFKKDPAPLGMSPVRFISEVPKFKLFQRADLTAMKRETMFIQLCEAIHPDEAAILIAIKDQNLLQKYPNITPEVLIKAGYLPPNFVSKAAVETPTKKSKVKDTVTRVKRAYKPRKKKDKVETEVAPASDPD
jgi:hypothetical protein